MADVQGAVVRLKAKCDSAIYILQLCSKINGKRPIFENLGEFSLNCWSCAAIQMFLFSHRQIMKQEMLRREKMAKEAGRFIKHIQSLSIAC